MNITFFHDHIRTDDLSSSSIPASDIQEINNNKIILKKGQIISLPESEILNLELFARINQCKFKTKNSDTKSEISYLASKIASLTGCTRLLSNIENITRILEESICSYYTKAGRYYHNLDHALKTSLLVKNSKLPEANHVALLLAAWFHDIIYDPKKHDNEEQSAILLKQIINEIGIPDKIIDKAAKLILITKKHLKAKTKLEKILVDADLFIFAEERSVYKKYFQDIRREYYFIEESLFNQKRQEFLEKILNYIDLNGNLFFNLHPMHEVQTKLNINYELDNFKTK